MTEDKRGLNHLSVIGYVTTEDFRRPGMGNARLRPVEYRAHGLALKGELTRALDEDADARRSILDVGELRALGTILVIEGAEASFPLELDRLTRMSTHKKVPTRPKWMLLSVEPAEGDQEERATVWVSDEYRQQFIKPLEDYCETLSTRGKQENWTTPQGNPANQALFANVARIRRAFLDDLWTSAGEPKRRGQHWWELWLDTTRPDHQNIDAYCQAYGLQSLTRSLTLGDRRIVWVRAAWSDLEPILMTSIPIAEIRRPEFIDTIEDLSIDGQDEYVADLAKRITPAAEHAPAVCHLDTGVYRQHLLLAGSLAERDQLTVIGTSGNDLQGHGTGMAGLALFGDSLDHFLLSNDPVVLGHRLESVKMCPGPHERQHEPRDFGTVTVEAITLPEINTQRLRVFCMPISANPDRPGEPTLWSATVDALAGGTDVGREGEELLLIGAPRPEAARLILIATGNVSAYQHDYRTESDTSPVEDPAQAWNAVTVGAHTDLVGTPSDPTYAGWRPVAGAGDLSPHSRTSIPFARQWPIKPDICMEGGNVLTDGATDFHERHPVLSLRTTGHRNDLSLTSANATSAATAQAARLAAMVMSRYPGYWPETVRGLLTHAAEWTPSMRRELDASSNKNGKLLLLRRYGWGVPTEGAVLSSRERAVTMVVQDQFVPFAGEEVRERRFRLHALPWPREVLEGLGETDVRLRVTLSYFIEPSASRRGWRQRYSYPSHGLRFDLQGTLESQQQFVQRVNRSAESEESAPIVRSSPATTSERWLLGSNQRHLGSLHQDDWCGAGAELARCNSIAVYPVGGWWKNNSRSERSGLAIRYSLLVSLRTAAPVDLYTPIANEIGLPVAIEIN